MHYRNTHRVVYNIYTRGRRKRKKIQQDEKKIASRGADTPYANVMKFERDFDRYAFFKISFSFGLVNNRNDVRIQTYLYDTILVQSNQMILHDFNFQCERFRFHFG